MIPNKNNIPVDTKENNKETVGNNTKLINENLSAIINSVDDLQHSNNFMVIIDSIVINIYIIYIYIYIYAYICIIYINYCLYCICINYGYLYSITI